MEDRFWAVWKCGLEWPQLYSNRETARERAHQLARQNIGVVIRLMKLTEIGTVRYPSVPDTSGECIIEIRTND